MDTKDPFDVYCVVINDEEQYSIWPLERDIPAGWKSVGIEGPKEDCLKHIGEVWTDMRPLSLRRKMEELAANPPIESEVDAPEPISLVERLSKSNGPIVFSPRENRTVAAFKERLDLGFVHLKFTATSGGTELGVRLDRDNCNLDSADFQKQEGHVHLEGELTLNFQKVRCVADIDLTTLEGTGKLVECVMPEGASV